MNGWTTPWSAPFRRRGIPRSRPCAAPTPPSAREGSGSCRRSTGGRSTRTCDCAGTNRTKRPRISPRSSSPRWSRRICSRGSIPRGHDCARSCARASVHSSRDSSGKSEFLPRGFRVGGFAWRFSLVSRDCGRRVPGWSSFSSGSSCMAFLARLDVCCIIGSGAVQDQ